MIKELSSSTAAHLTFTVAIHTAGHVYVYSLSLMGCTQLKWLVSPKKI